MNIVPLWPRVVGALALLVRALGQDAECFADGKALDAEALSAFTWNQLAANKSVEFYRCLHDATSLHTMLSALYFSNSAIPESVTLKEAPGLGTIWLNPEAKEHHLWYTHGHVHRRVILQGMSPTPDIFLDYASCDTSAGTICSVLEVGEKDDACIASKDEACKVQIAERMKELQDGQLAVDSQMKDGEVEGAFCSLAAVASNREDARQALSWLSGHSSAQCMLMSCNADDDTLLDYEAIYACTLKGNAFWATILCLLLLFYYFIVMGVVADGYLVPVLIQIGRGLKMSDALLGATLLALGGSANDFMIGFMSALANGGGESSESDVRLWLGGVFGTGVFINTFVASLVLLFAGSEGIQVNPSVLTRDISFRFLAVGLMILFGFFGFVSTYMALIMNLFYVLYVFLSLRESRRARRASADGLAASWDVAAGWRPRGEEGGGMENVSFPALAGEPVAEPPSFAADSWMDRLKLHAGWEEDGGAIERLSFALALPLRPLLVLTMATTTWDDLVNVLLPMGMCFFIPFGITGSPTSNLYTQAFEVEDSKSPWMARVTLVLFWLVGLALSLATWTTSRNLPPKHYVAQMSFNWATFLTSLLWVALLANEVVGAMQLVGTIMGLEPMPMGITLLAWGNCVDNVFGLLGLAKAGEFRVAITGIYAGPMFNVLFGNGSILLLSSILHGGRTPFMMTPCAFILLGSLEVILLATLLHSKVSGWRMTRSLGIFLGIAYPVVLVIGFAIQYGLYPSDANEDALIATS
ncbi:Cation/calcium exchanger 1 (AtCCX1) (Protein CATION EXCHANGER 7) [Durusdinium trenchii]|uniref:Cation/calcium exchanger 1 (AtCCX1) (Protein CATION EXCHANGER 7) n=1 Tax=Durusdinium trenchii TaxID=1381693 RepID=A0ABP0QG82_9DINO